MKYNRSILITLLLSYPLSTVCMEQPPQKSNSWGDWLLPYNSQAREAGEGVNNIGKALNKFSTDGVTLKTDKETIDSFREGTDAINNTSASIEKMGKTFDELNKED